MAQFPSTTSASDVWSLQDQYRAEAGDNWPELPPEGALVDLLLVAGGGGGGSTQSGDGGGAGGGAGGLLYYGLETPKTPNGARVLLSYGTTYTVTIGAGGTGGVTSGIGTNGVNSAFSGTGISYTAIGGGRGGAYPGAYPGGVNLSLYGGSGGGMYTGLTSSEPGQGNDGGYSNGASCYSGGGGGGAGGKGFRNTNEGNTSAPCTGGPGLAYAITGSSVSYAGGGGGAGRCGGYAGGVGGGGTGGSSAGTANTGGGGGGNSSATAFNGGSGICIVSSQVVAAATTGSPQYIQSGGRHIYRFTASGSIRF